MLGAQRFVGIPPIACTVNVHGGFVQLMFSGFACAHTFQEDATSESK